MARKIPQRPPSPAPARGPVPAAAPLPRVADLLDIRQPYLAAFVLVLVTRFVFARVLPNAAEDAYITFRYAANLAAGKGWSFNPGEHVMGFSSPLWTLWCALGVKLGLDPIAWTRASTVACDLVTLYAMVTLLRRHANDAAAWGFALFFASWPFFAAVATSGMESNAFLAALALGGLAIDQRSVVAGPLLAALVFIRPEGIVVAPLLAVAASRRDRLVAGGLLVAGLAALTAYFGSPIPQSVVAKALVYDLPGPWLGRHWWEWLSPAPLGRWPVLGETNFLIPLTLVFGPAVVLGVRTLVTRPAGVLRWTLAGPLAMFLGYALLGSVYFWWYLVVPLAGLAALAAIGLPQMVRGRAIWIALLLLLAGTWSMQPELYRARATSEYRSFVEARAVLLEHGSAGQKVMLEPIGIIGYQSPYVIIDETGLVSPQVSRRRMQGPGWYADIVRQERPDWLVVRTGVLANAQGFAGRGAPFRDRGERDALLAGYTRIAIVDSTSGANAMLILQRR